MKRWIHASEETNLPDGYLKTSRFTAPSINTDDKRNAVEALEIAISQKFDQFDKMCDITFDLTSSSSWSGVIDEYPEGYYITLEGTRSGFQAFVQRDDVIRKPRNLSPVVRKYYVQGERGTVYKIQEAKG